MNKEMVKRWVEAGIILAKDPTAEVDCPVCQMAMLLVKDVQRNTGSSEFERLMICPLCGAGNVLRMRDNK
ncbi:hypothetical protein [Achromobacter sp. NCFB-sbj8-Ac1-l]|uniref:hypothetical protein n=1 Tax=unclassified Achromobacter TaxID=2626865 RepID=UPI004046AD03